MKCSDVTWELRGEGCDDTAWKAEVGDLLWNPKMGEGHVMLARAAALDAAATVPH